MFHNLRAVLWFVTLDVTQSARVNAWAVFDFMVLAVAVPAAGILVALFTVAFRSRYPAATETNGLSERYVAGVVWMPSWPALLEEKAGFVVRICGICRSMSEN